MDVTSPRQTLGSALLALKERSGLPLARIATLAGYGSASAIQRFFAPNYDPKRPKIEMGRRLAKAFVGRGQPRIDAQEVIQLFGENIDLLREIHSVAAERLRSSNERIPLTSAVRLVDPLRVGENDSIDCFARDWNGKVISTPEHLLSLSLVGLFLPVANMWPKYEFGEFVIFRVDLPPQAGEYVLFEMEPEYDVRRACSVARLRKIVNDEVYFEQYSPPLDFVVPRSSVRYMFPAVKVIDLLPAIVINEKA